MQKYVMSIVEKNNFQDAKYCERPLSNYIIILLMVHSIIHLTT